MSDPILRVSDLTVQFGGVRACDSVSFDVERGELFALIGPNGAGKTTLVNAVTGVYAPLPGAAVEYTDRQGHTTDLLPLRPFQIARLGVARTFQNLGVFGSQTVLSNLMLGRYNHEKAGSTESGLWMRRAIRKELESRQAVERVIDLLDIAEYRWERVEGLPYGVQKRIELGRVLAMEPELLLLDEPMAGMTTDEKQDMVRFIYRAIDELGTTVLLIEHDMGVVMAIAERVMCLDFGRQIALGSPAEAQANEEVIQAYLGTD